MKDKDLTLKELRIRADKSGQLKESFDTVFSILEREFVNLATDEQACQKAGIAASTYYKWKEESEEFAILMDKAKNDPKLAAKYNIRVKIDEGDIDTSKWYIERAEKDDYSLRQEMTGAEGKDISKIKVEFIDGVKDTIDKRTEEDTEGEQEQEDNNT